MSKTKHHKHNSKLLDELEMFLDNNLPPKIVGVPIDLSSMSIKTDDEGNSVIKVKFDLGF